MNAHTSTTGELEAIASGQLRTHRLSQSSRTSTQNAAYRRLAAAILDIDVESVADKSRRS